MGGRISPGWTALLRSDVAEQLFDHPADATTVADGTRDSVKERAALIFFVVELFENAVITRPGDVVGRSLRGRRFIGGDAHPARSDRAEATWGVGEKRPAHGDGKGFGRRPAAVGHTVVDEEVRAGG